MSSTNLSADRVMVSITPATKMLNSLRSNTLNNEHAIADLIDNSLDMDVESTQVKIIKDGDRLLIIDDGIGMNYDVLVDAITMGSNGKNKPNAGDLGLFGMGLKNSSMALGRSLTIISKSKDHPHVTATYDLDDILERDDFSTPVGIATKEEIALFKVEMEKLKNKKGQVPKTGTILLIQKLDKIEYTYDAAFVTALVKYLGETFRFFLRDGIKITVNDKEVLPTSPFDIHYETSEKPFFIDQTFEFQRPGTDEKFTVRAVIASMPKVAEAEKMSSDIGYKNQGLYFMRNNRQIDRATWLKYRAKHPSSNRLRAEIFFSGAEDHEFGITFEKNHIGTMPQWFRDSFDSKIMSIISSQISKHKITDAPDLNSKEMQESLDKIKKHIDSKSNRIAPLKTKIKNTNTNPIVKPGDGEDPKPKDPNKPKRNYPAGTIKTKVSLIDFENAHLGSRLCFFEDKGNGALTVIFNVDHPFYKVFSLMDDEMRYVIIKLLLVFGRAFIKLREETKEYADLIEDLEQCIGDEARKLLD